MNAQGFEIRGEDKIISVCAVCHPRDTILLHHPELAGISYFTLSHGLCNKCLVKAKFEAAREQFKRTLQTVDTCNR